MITSPLGCLTANDYLLLATHNFSPFFFMPNISTLFSHAWHLKPCFLSQTWQAYLFFSRCTPLSRCHATFSLFFQQLTGSYISKQLSAFNRVCRTSVVMADCRWFTLFFLSLSLNLMFLPAKNGWNFPLRWCLDKHKFLPTSVPHGTQPSWHFHDKLITTSGIKPKRNKFRECVNTRQNTWTVFLLHSVCWH